MENPPQEFACGCGGVYKRIYTPPNLNFWFVDPREMNAEKEATDAGCYEEDFGIPDIPDE